MLDRYTSNGSKLSKFSLGECSKFSTIFSEKGLEEVTEFFTEKELETESNTEVETLETELEKELFTLETEFEKLIEEKSSEFCSARSELRREQTSQQVSIWKQWKVCPNGQFGFYQKKDP